MSSLLNFLSFSLLSHRGLSIKARIGHIKHLSLSTSVHLCVCLPSIIYSDNHYNFAVCCNKCCLLASFSLTTPLLELARILPQNFRCARKMSQSGDVQVRSSPLFHHSGSPMARSPLHVASWSRPATWRRRWDATPVGAHLHNRH